MRGLPRDRALLEAEGQSHLLYLADFTRFRDDGQQAPFNVNETYIQQQVTLTPDDTLPSLYGAVPLGPDSVSVIADAVNNTQTEISPVDARVTPISSRYVAAYGVSVSETGEPRVPSIFNAGLVGRLFQLGGRNAVPSSVLHLQNMTLMYHSLTYQELRETGVIDYVTFSEGAQLCVSNSQFVLKSCDGFPTDAQVWCCKETGCNTAYTTAAQFESLGYRIPNRLEPLVCYSATLPDDVAPSPEAATASASPTGSSPSSVGGSSSTPVRPPSVAKDGSRLSPIVIVTVIAFLAALFIILGLFAFLYRRKHMLVGREEGKNSQSGRGTRGSESSSVRLAGSSESPCGSFVPQDSGPPPVDMSKQGAKNTSAYLRVLSNGQDLKGEDLGWQPAPYDSEDSTPRVPIASAPKAILASRDLAWRLSRTQLSGLMGVGDNHVTAGQVLAGIGWQPTMGDIGSVSYKLEPSDSMVKPYEDAKSELHEVVRGYAPSTVFSGNFSMNGNAPVLEGSRTIVATLDSPAGKETASVKFFADKKDFEAMLEAGQNTTLQRLSPQILAYDGNEDKMALSPAGVPLPPYVIEERGVPVDEWWSKSAVDETLVLQMLVSVGSVLVDLHAANYAHRNVKPSNILVMNRPSDHSANGLSILPSVSGDPLWQLSDFDCAAPIGSRSRPVVSPVFCAPEIMEAVGMHTTFVEPLVRMESDVWALGMVAYTMVCGESPWAPEVEDCTTTEQVCGKVYRFLSDGLRFPWEVNQIPTMHTQRMGKLQKSIMSMLRRNHTLRPSMQQLVSDWKRLLQLSLTSELPSYALD